MSEEDNIETQDDEMNTSSEVSQEIIMEESTPEVILPDLLQLFYSSFLIQENLTKFQHQN